MKWIPIEEAPQDKPVLVTDGYFVMCGAFTDYYRHRRWFGVAFENAGRWNVQQGEPLFNLTHFMSLPEAPEVNKERQNG
jgi:hypothetical protein